jgi:hypothetical protein
LGIPFGIQISLAQQWRWIMAKFEKKLQAWCHLDLLLTKNVTVVDKILVIRDIYYSSCLFPSQSTYRMLEQGFKSFWGGKQGREKGIPFVS